MKPRATHTAFPTGKRVKVILRNGTSFIAKFKEAKRGRLFFERRSILIDRIRSATIYRGSL